VSQLIKKQTTALMADVKLRGSLLGTGLASLWLVHLANVLLMGSLNGFGIVPRTVQGLWGILFSPFLHGSLSHLINNSIAFVWLGLLTTLRRPLDLVGVTLIGGLIAGLGTWLTGGVGTVHIGFSGVIFAYLGFLLTRGWFERSFGAIAVSVVSFLWFGSMIWGVLPNMPGVSWQAHLFGFIGGIVAARALPGGDAASNGSTTKAKKRKRSR